MDGKQGEGLGIGLNALTGIDGFQREFHDSEHKRKRRLNALTGIDGFQRVKSAIFHVVSDLAS